VTSSLAITSTFRDVVHTTIGLGLSTHVGGITGWEATREERTSKLCAPTLAIDIMVGIDKDTTGDGVAHALAICDGVDEAVSEIVRRLDRTRQVCERNTVAVQRFRGRALQEVREKMKDLTDEAREPGNAWVGLWVVAVIPSGLAPLGPRRDRCTVLVASVEVVNPTAGNQASSQSWHCGNVALYHRQHLALLWSLFQRRKHTGHYMMTGVRICNLCLKTECGRRSTDVLYIPVRAS